VCVCARACDVLDVLKGISNFLLGSNLCVCSGIYYFSIREKEGKVSIVFHHTLFFSARKSLTKYLLVTDSDCQLTDYGLVFMKTMMKLLKSGVMRSVKQELIISYMFLYAINPYQDFL